VTSHTISTIINGLKSPVESFDDGYSDERGFDSRLFAFAEVGESSKVGLPAGLPLGLLRSYKRQPIVTNQASL